LPGIKRPTRIGLPARSVEQEARRMLGDARARDTIEVELLREYLDQGLNPNVSRDSRKGDRSNQDMFGAQDPAGWRESGHFLP
jgi:hypothetical protein